MKTEQKTTSFEWKPLIKIPEHILAASFISGSNTQAFLEEYKGRVRADYQGNRYLDVLNYDKSAKTVTGSNPFVVILVNKILKQEGITTATQADLEKILELNALPLQGHYEDSSLVYRNEKEPNSYLAAIIAKQLKARGVKNAPVMLPLYQLDILNDSNSPCGLSFNLQDDCQPIYAEQLDYKNNDKVFSKTDENGLPIFDDNGKRTLYTRQNGLSRLYLSRDLIAGSYYGILGGSDASGRVVLIRSEAAQKNLLDVAIEELRQQHEQMQKDISDRYQRAVSILKGKE